MSRAVAQTKHILFCHRWSLSLPGNLHMSTILIKHNCYYNIYLVEFHQVTRRHPAFACLLAMSFINYYLGLCLLHKVTKVPTIYNLDQTQKIFIGSLDAVYPSYTTKFFFGLHGGR